jgi:hypothetical protein
MPEKKVFILMCEEVKGKAQGCRFCGHEFSDQEVHPAEEIINRRSTRMLSISCNLLFHNS